ncbi:MAG: TonB-dependent receptor [Pasteurellaceae bacterium]|nr:TonB-dependent receptor [Pasteurellaceae bacterium]
MKLNPVTQGILFACVGLASASLMAQTQAESSELQFDELTISAEKVTPKQKTFGTPGAVSMIGQDKQMRSLDSVIRALPGTYTNINPTQGTVSVNIRGLSGFGRVNSMIDGVPQTFYGTSANSASRYHAQEKNGYGPSSSFGAMIDANFLAGMEVKRGANHGASGVNALSGSSNIRTIGVDDVVFEGNKVGVLSKFSYGTNGIGKSGMLALGGKHHFSDDNSLGAFFAYSGSKMKANYKRGDGAYSQEKGFVRRLDQEPRSWLSKIEWKNEDHNLLLTGRGYQNNVGGRQAKNKSYALDYQYNPASKWVNVKLLAATNQSDQNYHDDANIWLLTKAKTKNKADYLDLNNTSSLQFGDVDVSLNYGINLLKNSYIKQATGINEDNETYTPFAPQGKQSLRSGYISGALDYRHWNLEVGTSYTHSQMQGYKPPCDIVKQGSTIIPSHCFPTYAAQVKTISRLTNSSIGLSYNASDWFSPFIRYAQSSRVPNLQEVFFSNEGSGSMNPYLKPEYAKTLEIGFNTHKHYVFTENDTLGIKFVGYQRQLKDYIYSQSFYMGPNGLTHHLTGDVSADFHAQIYTNAVDKLPHKGIELDIDYDAGTVFASLAYSYQKTTLPPDVTATTSTGFGTTSVTTTPKHVATLTLGGRLLNQALTLGTTFKYTGKSKRYLPNGLEVDNKELLQDLPQMPIIIDLFGHYQINKHVLLKMSIQNLTNRNYVDALNSLNSTASQHDVDNSGNNYTYSFSNAARGRTYLFGAEIRF